jgi:NodT family efflux transporter outer membrane factor (OMF) lipoprotein
MYLLVGCSSWHIKPNDRRKELQIPKLEFHLYTSHQPSPQKWWHKFHSNELNQLIERCLDKNLDLAQAVARLKRAHAITKQMGSRKSIKLNAKGDVSKLRNRTSNSTTDFSAAGIAASYEVDLWGSINSRVKAAELNEEVAKELLYSLQISLVSEVTTAWLKYIRTQEEITLLRQQLKTNEKTLDLMLRRLQGSQATALDVFQHKQKVASNKLQIIAAESKLPTINSQIQVLIGASPLEKVEISAKKLPSFFVLTTTGIPADLLANRPDIRANGLALHAREWSVAAAKADRLPQLSISGSAQYNGKHMDDLFDNWLANLAASLVMPMIDGGFRKSEVIKLEAEAEEKLAIYKKSVLNAVAEVTTILENNHLQELTTQAIEEQNNLATQTHYQAVMLYRNGLETYLPDLFALATKQDLELKLIEAKFNTLNIRVNLYRSLGGSWPILKEGKNND